MLGMSSLSLLKRGCRHQSGSLYFTAAQFWGGGQFWRAAQTEHISTESWAC